MLTQRLTSARACRAQPQQLSRVTPARPVLGSRPPSTCRSRTVICQGLFGLGLPEIAVIAGVAALVFGPSKLPELGKGLGKTVKSFQTAASEFNQELKAGMESDAAKKPADGKLDEPSPPKQ